MIKCQQKGDHCHGWIILIYHDIWKSIYTVDSIITGTKHKYQNGKFLLLVLCMLIIKHTFHSWKWCFGHFGYLWYFDPIFPAPQGKNLKSISTNKKLKPRPKRKKKSRLENIWTKEKTLAHWLIFIFTIFNPTYCPVPLTKASH